MSTPAEPYDVAEEAEDFFDRAAMGDAGLMRFDDFDEYQLDGTPRDGAEEEGTC